MKSTIKLFSILSLTLCASLCGMEADEQPEADSITVLREQEKKSEWLQRQEAKLRELEPYLERDLADKFGYGEDLQNDGDDWFGFPSLSIEYSLGDWRERRDCEAWRRLGRALFSGADDEKKSPEEKQDEAP